MTGCEEITPEIEGKINIVDSLISIGLKGYAIDSVYTEFDFYQGTNARITGFRKGIIRQEDGVIQSIQWSNTSPTVEYGGSYINYSYEGLRSEIWLNAHGFADIVTNRNSDGSLQSSLKYVYDAAGRLQYVCVERLGLAPVYVSYEYKDDSISILEENIAYQIPLSVQKETNKKRDNVGYICDVLRIGASPLTKAYVIIPDLYYQGIYGMPVKYLPADLIESRDLPNGTQSITRVGNSQFFYR
ncbi:MAG: hypothetical protein LBB90_09045 [Tannerella sp.]|nr:hypothetical protein [Tannerella sp.]